MKNKLLIWTNNPGKLKRRSKYFGDMFEIVSLSDCKINLEIEESMDNLKENAIKKAKIYSKISWLLTLSEDSGFFIEELWWKPWVAVRRRWWELPNEINDSNFLDFFKDKVKHLKNTEAYFEFEIAIATPDWKVQTVNSRHNGYLDKDKLDNIDSHDAGYPLSKCFVNYSDGKTWAENSDKEREEKDKDIIEKIKKILIKFYSD